MRLKCATIENFRSIKSQEITFDPTCRILVGINESGKSNVLKALRLLSSESISPTDVRFELDDEDIKKAYVRFVFTLETDDLEEIYSKVQDVIYPNNPLLVSKKSINFSLKELCATQKEGIYHADILGGKKMFQYWTMDECVVNENLKKPIANCPAAIKFTVSDGSSYVLNQFKIVDQSCIQEDLSAYLENISYEDISRLLGAAIIVRVQNNLPDCVYWSYDVQFLLPARVQLSSFIANPSSCVPLKNMFEMAGEGDIQNAFKKAREKKHGERNLLNRVSRITTEHIRSIWKEYKTIEIILEPYGADYIDAGVKDKTNLFDFASRSDGFKRFVSFLLMISAQVKTNSLQNTLILIDEPENGLHPRGAKYLLDELLAIAKENYVVFSTHSIFMIDRNNVGRHIIVRKKDEITTLKNVDESNFQDEEVIYNALGSSVFESLKEENLVFEGWKDKKLFQVALTKLPTKFNELKDKFGNVGIAHLQGVKDANRIAPILDLANRKYHILSDDDTPAKEAQKNFIGEYGKWLRYSEIIGAGVAITGEDFIKPEPFIKAISNLKKDYLNLTEIGETELKDTGGKIAGIKKWLHGLAFDKPTSEEIIKKVKDYVFENLKHNHIEESYYELLNKIVL